MREGAHFCSNCGFSRVSPQAIPKLEELRFSGGRFDSYWSEIKQLMWLFGLLLFTSFVLGMINRNIASPWPVPVMSGIDAVIVLVFASMRYRDILQLLVLPQFHARGALKLMGLAVGFIAVMSAYFALIKRAGAPISHIATFYKQSGWPVWAMFLLISIMPAIFEELAFRGVIQSGLERVLGEREAWLIQAALFSVLHLLPMMFPSHFVMGLCFGYMRLRTRSLYPGMILHASWNALVLSEELYWP